MINEEWPKFIGFVSEAYPVKSTAEKAVVNFDEIWILPGIVVSTKLERPLPDKKDLLLSLNFIVFALENFVAVSALPDNSADKVAVGDDVETLKAEFAFA